MGWEEGIGGVRKQAASIQTGSCRTGKKLPERKEERDVEAERRLYMSQDSWVAQGGSGWYMGGQEGEARRRRSADSSPEARGFSTSAPVTFGAW